MASMEQEFPEPARGTFVPDEEFLREGAHVDGWNRAIDDALQNFGRKPGSRYQVTVVLSALVEETDNPGRINAYIATII